MTDKLDVSRMPWLRRAMAGMVDTMRRHQIANAYLLHGPAGLGQRILAEAMQALLMCTTPGETAACGRCPSCRHLAADVHPDAWRLEPHSDGHAIKIDQIRELIERLQQTAQFGGYRCVTVMPADALNLAASNSLLKILEEPGDKVVFFLVSEHPERLLPTVRSRCQTIPLNAPDEEEVWTWLHSQLGDTKTMPLDKAWLWSGRMPIAALELLTSGELDQIDELVAAWEALGASAELSKWMKLCDQYGADWMLDTLHRYVALNISGWVRGAGHSVPWFWLHDQLIELKRLRGAGVNLNTQLMWEKLALQWQQACRYAPPLKVAFSEV